MLALLALITTQAEPKLVASLENVKDAAAYRYAAKDDKGSGLDCLKIVELGPKSYLGLYHWNEGGVFKLKLARSSDLLNWTFVRDLDDHAHQGTLSGTTGPVLLAYEKDGPNGNWIRLRHYTSSWALIDGRDYKEYDLPRTLSKHAEGTPSILNVSVSTNPVGMLRFHYLTDNGVDRQAMGYFNLESGKVKQWRAWANERLNENTDALGIHGNFGDRDLFGYGAGGYEIIEGQLKKNDWSSWRVFLTKTLNAEDVNRGQKPTTLQLNIKTHSGSTSFANPAVTELTLPSGEKGLVVTLFLPGEGSAKGESGSLIYYFKS